MFPHAIQQLQDISTYRINSSTRILQEILQLQGSSRAELQGIFQQLFPMHPSILHSRIRLRLSTAQAGFQLILPGRNSILSGSQHPRSPYNSSQVHSYKILQGEIGFISKGSSIAYLCNTKVSVFQFTYSCFRIILQEY